LAALSFITGIIALAWAGQYYDEGPFPTTKGSFTNTALAWVSFAVIAGAFSLFGGIVLIATHKQDEDDKDKNDSRKHYSRGFSTLIVLLYCTVIGIVAALFKKHFFERDMNVYGNSPLVVGADHDNFGNSVSPFAWEFSIWTSAVAASFGIEALKYGVPSAGITALTFTTGANLLGWVAEHIYIGPVAQSNFRSLTRAWQGLALCAAGLAIILAFVSLHGSRDKGEATTATTIHQSPDGDLSAALFKNEGARKQQGGDH